MMVAINIVKALHIAGIALWGAGLIGLPLLLARHDPDDPQDDYTRVRRFTHYGYTHLLTPAAVIAVTAGTALIFLREMFVPWMFAKLLLVGMLVVVHIWIGNTVVKMGEERNRHQPPPPALVIGSAGIVLFAILLIVLVKPAIGVDALPEWLLSPRERQLPFDEVPI